VNQSAELQALQTQVGELTTHLEGLEKERDFYFDKLRQIEIIVQAQMETLEAEGKDDKTLKEIQAILYSTEVSTDVCARGLWCGRKLTGTHLVGGLRSA